MSALGVVVMGTRVAGHGPGRPGPASRKTTPRSPATEALLDEADNVAGAVVATWDRTRAAFDYKFTFGRKISFS